MGKKVANPSSMLLALDRPKRNVTFVDEPPIKKGILKAPPRRMVGGGGKVTINDLQKLHGLVQKNLQPIHAHNQTSTKAIINMWKHVQNHDQALQKITPIVTTMYKNNKVVTSAVKNIGKRLSDVEKSHHTLLKQSVPFYQQVRKLGAHQRVSFANQKKLAHGLAHIHRKVDSL